MLLSQGLFACQPYKEALLYFHSSFGANFMTAVAANASIIIDNQSFLVNFYNFWGAYLSAMTAKGASFSDLQRFGSEEVLGMASHKSGTEFHI